MNKKIGFTLAEVLITIGIVGVVASVTIPTVIKNTEKKDTVAKVKEIYSILAQATTQINNDCGGSINNCLTNPNASGYDIPTTRQVANLYKAKLSIAKDCTNGTTVGCMANLVYKLFDGTDYWNLSDPSYFLGFTLLDGIAMDVKWSGPGGSVPKYIFGFLVDINGTKAPNILGKDVFVFTYDTSKNNTMTVGNPSGDCGVGSFGTDCSGYIIQKGIIDYY
jgi:prepilin-type N-terminal cleavage/methylation domain-containing protein